jgi:hypothetical protein
MAITWDKTDDNVWYGKFTEDAGMLQIYLVAEHLPESARWAWTIWQAHEPRVLRRGTAPDAAQAVIAAEKVAIVWRKIESGDSRRARPVNDEGSVPTIEM